MGPNVFGDGMPHEVADESETEKEVNQYASDDMVDQRITHMHETSEVRGRQLPGFLS